MGVPDLLSDLRRDSGLRQCLYMTRAHRCTASFEHYICRLSSRMYILEMAFHVTGSNWPQQQVQDAQPRQPPSLRIFASTYTISFNDGTPLPFIPSFPNTQKRQENMFLGSTTIRVKAPCIVGLI